MASGKDDLFQTSQGEANFAFDQAVTEVFPDMIERSVPGYIDVSRMGAQMVASHLLDGTNVYDLGASLLHTTKLIAGYAPDADVRLVAIDRSEAMVHAAREQSPLDPRIEILQADICAAPLSRASAVVLNWTLQFLPPATRQPLLQKIHDSLVPGGLLVLSEKIECGGPGDFGYDQHIRFKRYNGYSNAEVENKLASLQNVMVPDTLDTHLERLSDVGFSAVHTWYRCWNWASFAAIK